jgi:hypothetical protein
LGQVTLGSDCHRHQTLFRDSHIVSEDWQSLFFLLLGFSDRVAQRHPIDSVPSTDGERSSTSVLIIAADTSFGSNRFV